MFVQNLRSKRIRLKYGLRKAKISKATFYRKLATMPNAPEPKYECDGTVSFDRAEVDRFVEAIAAERDET